LLAVVLAGSQAVLPLPAKLIVLPLVVALGMALRVLLAKSPLARPLVELQAGALMEVQRPTDLETHLSASSSELQN